MTPKTSAQATRHEPASTPAPWAVGEIRPDGEYDERMIDTGPGGAVICSVWPMGADFDTVSDFGSVAPERDANARLIAAAPEMREELARFVDHYTPPSRTAQLGNGEALQHYDRARALLARIDGKEGTN